MLRFPSHPNQRPAGTNNGCQAPNSRRDDSDWSDGRSLGVPEFFAAQSGAAEVLFCLTRLRRSVVVPVEAAPDEPRCSKDPLISFQVVD